MLLGFLKYLPRTYTILVGCYIYELKQTKNKNVYNHYHSENLKYTI